jgi:broad specificity phosphatase PhoE
MDTPGRPTSAADPPDYAPIPRPALDPAPPLLQQTQQSGKPLTDDRSINRVVDHLRAHVAELRRLENQGADPHDVEERRLLITRLQTYLAGAVRDRVSEPCKEASSGNGCEPTVRLFIFARHGESTANAAHLVSSDPSRLVGLTPRGEGQARELGAQIASLDVERAIATRLARTRQTAELALDGRGVPVIIDPDFDEVRAGDWDGEPIEEYWAWRQQHGSSDRFPHGETVNEALLRYARALRRLLAQTRRVSLVVLHEFALRQIAHAASESSVPATGGFGNSIPYLFDEPAVSRAAAGLATIARAASRQLVA